MQVTVLQEATQLDVSTLKPHPENPNRGDVNAIAESLEQFGQFRPIVVNQDGTILAGHHVWQAAKNIKMATILATVVEADEQTSLAILLADNRLADLGEGFDNELLFDALSRLDDLTGTGYDESYIKMLEESLQGAPSLDDLGKEAGDVQDDDFATRLTLLLDTTVAEDWKQIRANYDDDTAALSAVLEAYGTVNGS